MNHGQEQEQKGTAISYSKTDRRIHGKEDKQAGMRNWGTLKRSKW